MKTRPIWARKRGAVELSMTTVVVVVIGITLLTLGLRWVYSIFEGLGEEQTKLKELTDQQIVELFGNSASAINLPQPLASVEQGKKLNLRVNIRNIKEETHSFKYDVIVDNVPTAAQSLLKNKLVWFKGALELSSGKGVSDFITFDTRGLPLGTYRFRVVLDCSDCGVEDKETIPLIIEVASN